MGALFNAALVFTTLSMLATIAFLVARSRRRTLLHSVTIAIAFGLGAAFTGAVAAFLSAAILGRGAVLDSIWQVVAYLSYLAFASVLGGFLVARRVWRSSVRWSGL